MKKIYKSTYMRLAIALLAGVLIGWLISTSAYQTIVPSNNQTINKSDHHHISTSNVWTCSMHPQVRQSEPGKCPLCGMDLIPGSSDGSSASVDPMVYEMTPEAVAMANIQTSRVSGISPQGEIFLSGKVKADEQGLASITAKFPGRIERLFVNFTGQSLQKGDRIATIYSPDLLTAQKELLEALKSSESYPELYQAAREKLQHWKLTKEQIDEIENIGKVKDQFDVFADKSGIVTQRNVTLGDYVDTGAILYEVMDLRRVWVMLDAYETDLPFVKVGDEVSFTVAGIGKTFNGKVNYIDPIINPETRVASVRAEIINTKGELKPEMFVNGKIRTSLSREQSSLAIPRTALLWTGKRSIVYVKVPQSEFPAYEMREVTVGPRNGEMYLVEAGLEVGEEIVTNGVFAVDAAAQLTGNYSMLNRPESKTLEVSGVFSEQITAIADAYFDVKNALVKGDALSAKTALEQMQALRGKVKLQNLNRNAHDHWMVLNGQLSDVLGTMVRSDKLEAQRGHFALLSTHIIEMTESFGLEKDRVFKNFCPMAFNDKGAFWLSESKDIRNPYYGDAMLTCGEVKETYLKGQRVFESENITQNHSKEGHNH